MTVQVQKQTYPHTTTILVLTCVCVCFAQIPRLFSTLFDERVGGITKKKKKKKHSIFVNLHAVVSRKTNNKTPNQSPHTRTYAYVRVCRQSHNAPHVAADRQRHLDQSAHKSVVVHVIVARSFVNVSLFLAAR